MFLAALALLAATEASAFVQIKDDLGRTVRLEEPARRIVALYGAFNEILAEMGLEDRIAARTKADKLPPSILDKPCIGTHMRPNVEMVFGLKPDLVLQMGGRRDASVPVEALEKLGLKTAFFKPANFEELFSVINRLGVLTGTPDRAEALVKSLEKRLAVVKKSASPGNEKPRVFFEVRHPNLLGAGKGSIITDIIAKAGGLNCLDNPKKLVRLSEEELIRLDPDIYLVQKGPMNPAPAPVTERPHYKGLKAVRRGQVYEIDEQIFSRPGPRNVEAVERLSEILHAQQRTDPQSGE